jgi:hydrogenase maturation factor
MCLAIPGRVIETHELGRTRRKKKLLSSVKLSAIIRELL